MEPTPVPGPPVTFSVDHPDRPLNRLTTALRAFTLIPIAIVLSVVSGPAARSWYSHNGGAGTTIPPPNPDRTSPHPDRTASIA